MSVYNAPAGKEEATFEIPFGQVAGLDWLSPDAFVSASGVNGQDFCYLKGNQTDSGSRSNSTSRRSAPMLLMICFLALPPCRAIPWPGFREIRFGQWM